MEDSFYEEEGGSFYQEGMGTQIKPKSKGPYKGYHELDHF